MALLPGNRPTKEGNAGEERIGWKSLAVIWLAIGLAGGGIILWAETADQPRRPGTDVAAPDHPVPAVEAAAPLPLPPPPISANAPPPMAAPSEPAIALAPPPTPAPAPAPVIETPPPSPVLAAAPIEEPFPEMEPLRAGPLVPPANPEPVAPAIVWTPPPIFVPPANLPMPPPPPVVTEERPPAPVAQADPSLPREPAPPTFAAAPPSNDPPAVAARPAPEAAPPAAAPPPPVMAAPVAPAPPVVAASPTAEAQPPTVVAPPTGTVLAAAPLTAILAPALPAIPTPDPNARPAVLPRPRIPANSIPAPDPALLEPSRHGSLPRRGPDGRTPMQVYAQPYTRTDRNRPRLAIIVADNGLSTTLLEEAIQRLPRQIAIALSPYSQMSAAMAEMARERGIETLISLPLEPSGYPFVDPGVRAMLTAQPAAQNADNLDWVLSRFSGYVGAIGALGAMRGERFAQNAEQLARLQDTLTGRGLLYIDPRPLTLLPARISGRGVDMVLDDPPTRTELDRRLPSLETAARLRASAVGFAGSMSPMLLDRLVAWATGIEARGISLVPITALIRQGDSVSATQPASAER